MSLLGPSPFSLSADMRWVVAVEPAESPQKPRAQASLSFSCYLSQVLFEDRKGRKMRWKEVSVGEGKDGSYDSLVSSGHSDT